MVWLPPALHRWVNWHQLWVHNMTIDWTLFFCFQGICDGAASVLLASEAAVSESNLKPLARLVAYSTVGVRPEVMGIGPVPAIQNVLKAANLTLDDIDLIEVPSAIIMSYGWTLMIYIIFVSQMVDQWSLCRSDIGLCRCTKIRHQQAECKRRCYRFGTSIGRIGRTHHRTFGSWIEVCITHSHC